MTTPSPISVGQRFRDVHSRSFGRPGLEWVVDELITATDGIAHACLVCAGDQTRRKTLSFAVLGDRHRFQRVEDR
jgi:hypothetical protein